MTNENTSLMQKCQNLEKLGEELNSYLEEFIKLESQPILMEESGEINTINKELMNI